MREEQILRETRRAPWRATTGSETPLSSCSAHVLGGEGERHEAGADVGELQPELPREAVAEIGRAELGERKPAGGDDERRALERAGAGLEAKAVAACALR